MVELDRKAEVGEGKAAHFRGAVTGRGDQTEPLSTRLPPTAPAGESLTRT